MRGKSRTCRHVPITPTGLWPRRVGDPKKK